MWTTTSSFQQQFPRIYGSLVVWEDFRNQSGDLYGYDLSTRTEIVIANGSSNQWDAAVDGLSVAFTDYRNGNLDVYVKRPPAGQRALEALDLLAALVVSFNLEQGISNSLDTKLTNIQEALNAANAGQRQDAANLLQAFINSVEAQRGKQLTSAQADELIALARRILGLL